MDYLLDYVNSLDSDIKFTLEKEGNNGTLPFLDVLVHRLDNNHLFLSLYQKPTHSNRFLHFESNHPKQTKIGVVKALKHRIEAISDKPEVDKKVVKKQLIDSGYPVKVVNSILDENIVKNYQTDKEKKKILVLPYFKETSEKVSRLLKKNGVTLVNKGGVNLKRIFSQNQENKNKNSNVLDVRAAVYKVSCECGVDYIGETKRPLKKRFAGHKDCIKKGDKENGPAVHIWDSKNKDCMINFDAPTVLYKEGNIFKRRFVEAIHINNTKKEIMNLNNGFEEAKSWGVVSKKYLFNDKK